LALRSRVKHLREEIENKRKIGIEENREKSKRRKAIANNASQHPVAVGVNKQQIPEFEGDQPRAPQPAVWGL
jgi:hypothetical protein